ncbi:MAG: N-acetylmuramic acid 6-phosphate etherase [bacterium]|nr:N-acetylmuramic acid 6-phosphate etherase [bacterium]
MSEIITEYRNENTKDIDLLSTIDVVRKINEEDRLVAGAVYAESTNIAHAIDIISKQFLAGGRLFYFGAGTSGRLGVLDASECPPTFGVDRDMVQGIIAGGESALRVAAEGVEDNFDNGFKDASVLTSQDVCVVISASGNPKYLLGVLAKAEEKGCKTIAITCNHKATILEEVGLGICVEVGPEVIAGSSRMKAGTAQKMILNMLTTGAMIKIGKTYENYMIDLMPTNEKLKDRAVRIVAELANVAHSDALKVLLECNWSVKIAVLVLKCNISQEYAKDLLKKNHGVLRLALSEYFIPEK